MVAVRDLDVWMNGELVGHWQASQRGNPVFRYAESWLASANSRSLSLSLPIVPGNEPHRGPRVEAWFDNLLPENRDLRQRLAVRFNTKSSHAFDLLAAIGRDCAGAVQLVPAGEGPGDVRRIEAEPMDDAQVARLLRDVSAGRSFGQFGASGDFRISIAGAQEKTALFRRDGRWFAPRGATPTTHLLKLPLGFIGNPRFNMQESVENEWLCMQILREMGLSVAQTEIAAFSDDLGEQRALVVDRFDRQVVRVDDGSSADWVLRLPQEDLCQAVGLPPERKYESDGGPGIADILNLLRAGDHALGDELSFAKAQLAFWLLAAIDGHAKNFSIFLGKSGYRLTPLYDVISAWPVIGRGAVELAVQDATLAMGLRGDGRLQRHIDRIGTRHWMQLANRMAVPNAAESLIAFVEELEPAIGRLEARLPLHFPEHVWSSITRGALAQRDNFRRGLALGSIAGSKGSDSLIHDAPRG